MTKAHERASRIRAIQALQNLPGELHGPRRQDLELLDVDGIVQAIGSSDARDGVLDELVQHARDYGTLAVLEGGQRG